MYVHTHMHNVNMFTNKSTVNYKHVPCTYLTSENVVIVVASGHILVVGRIREDVSVEQHIEDLCT